MQSEPFRYRDWVALQLIQFELLTHVKQIGGQVLHTELSNSSKYP